MNVCVLDAIGLIPPLDRNDIFFCAIFLVVADHVLIDVNSFDRARRHNERLARGIPERACSGAHASPFLDAFSQHGERREKESSPAGAGRRLAAGPLWREARFETQPLKVAESWAAAVRMRSADWNEPPQAATNVSAACNCSIGTWNPLVAGLATFGAIRAMPVIFFGS